jgi:hypothetical protein
VRTAPAAGSTFETRLAAAGPAANMRGISSTNFCARRDMLRKLLLALCFGVLLACPGRGEACTAATMKTTDGGLVLKVIGGSDKIEASKQPGGKDTAFTLELLAPYSEAWIVENNDVMPRHVQMDRNTLQRLIALFAALGRIDVTASERKAGIAQALGAIAGTDYDPRKNVSATPGEHLGFELKTRLLDADLEALAKSESPEQQARIRQFQSERQSLEQLLDAHGTEFDRNSVAWIPGEHLP